MNRIENNASVAVIGAGTMGAGIAQVAATFGHDVSVFDTIQEARDRARDGLDNIMQRLVAKGRLSEGDAAAIRNRVRFVSSIEDLAESRLVIEAIVEDLTVKKATFARLEATVAADCVLATNTSSLPIAAIASACTDPGRVLGVHFFNPAPLMPLVEIVPGIASSSDVVTATRALIDTWGKTTVLAKDTPGFIVNRVARPFYGEALRILEEGIADAETIDAAMRDIGGFRMGPFELMDFIGHDVNLKVTETVFEAFFYDPRYRPSFTQQRLVDAGRLGRKSGSGFYEYGDDKSAPRTDVPSEVGKPIVDRILAMLINEAADALFWQIATRDDIDLAMTKGVNYPKGLLAWADDIGIDVVLEHLEALQDEYGEDRYRPSPLLRRMSREGRTFY